MALQFDPKWTPALVNSARALADENPPQATTLARRALETNPSSVDAFVFLAAKASRWIGTQHIYLLRFS
jgi:hypothetical protein